jgi:long-chain fatty acid transport protein
MFLAYNFGETGKGRLAAFMQAGIVAGGGELKWKDGTAGTTLLLTGISAGSGGALGAIKSQEFDASSIYYGVGVGVSYAFAGDAVSVSLGGRSVMANRSFGLTAAYSSSADLHGEYEYKAKGFTPIVGIDIKPNKDLTFAAKFEAPTSLEFEYKQKELGGVLANTAVAALRGAGIEDGKKVRQDLPAIISLGAGYNVNDRLTLDLSGTFYLLSSANLGDVYAGGSKVGEVSDYFDTGWELAFGAKYKVLDNLKIGAGAMYTEVGAKQAYLNDSGTAFNASANPMLNSIALGTGVTYSARNNLDFTCSFLWSHYLPENFSIDTGAFKVSGKYGKDALGIGYGVSYRF